MYVPMEKNALSDQGTPGCRNGGPGNGVPTHFNPWGSKVKTYSDPSFTFSRGQDPQPHMIYAPDVDC